MQRDRDKALTDSKVKAQIFTHLLYRHWNHFTATRGPTSFSFRLRLWNPRLTPMIPTTFRLFARGGGGFAFAPIRRNSPSLRISIPSRHQHQRRHLHARPHQPRRQAGQGKHISGGTSTRLFTRRKISGVALQARAGYEADKFRLASTTAPRKRPRMCCQTLIDGRRVYVGPDSRRIFFVSSQTGEEPLFIADLDGES